MGQLAKQTGLVGLLLVAVIAAYWTGLDGGFFFDDEPNILQAQSLRLTELSIPQLQEAWNSGRAGLGGRPIAQLSFALNHYFSGFDPFVFKATNLAIHVLTCVLVFLVAKRLLLVPIYAGVAAALWLLHPIQITSVLYVVQRMTSLSALFLLAGFLLHMAGREQAGSAGISRILFAWFVCWPLAILAKETAVLFPLFVLIWELIVRRNALGRLDRFALMQMLVVGLASVASLVYLLLPAGQWLWAGYEMRSFTLVERLLTEGRVLWFYLGLIVFPRLEAFGLYHDDIPISTALLTPWTTLPAWLGLIMLGWVAWYARRRAPLLCFGFAWFLVGHLLESTVLPLEIAHEHRNYLPSFGLFIAAAWGLMQVVQHAGWQKTLGIALAAVFVAYSFLVTALRAHQYGDDIRRTQIESQHHPESARTHYEAGRALVSRVEIDSANSPQYFFARKHYEKAGELDPNHKVSWLGLIHLNCQIKESVEPEWVDALARRLVDCPLGPGDRNILFSIKEMTIAGTLCLSRGDVERLFNAATMNRSASAQVKMLAHSWLADYLVLAARDLSAAQTELDKALAIAPHNPSNRLKRAQLAFLQGRYEEASAMLDRLQESSLLRSERETMALLRTCMGPEGKTKCARL